MAIHQYKNKRKQRQARVRAKISGTSERPRLAVFRSLQHIYVQVIDDTIGATLVAAFDGELKNVSSLSRKEKARKVGELVAKKALKAKIKAVVFDRGGYRYQGRVELVAQGAREGGLSL